MLQLKQKTIGYLQIFNPDGAVQECDTATCSHCNKVMFLKPFTRPEDANGYCDKCDKIICPRCLNIAKKDGEKCIPWEKKMEEMEAKFRFRQAMAAL